MAVLDPSWDAPLVERIPLIEERPNSRLSGEIIASGRQPLLAGYRVPPIEWDCLERIFDLSKDVPTNLTDVLGLSENKFLPTYPHNIVPDKLVTYQWYGVRSTMLGVGLV